MRVLPNTNWNATLCSQKPPVSIRLQQDKAKTNVNNQYNCLGIRLHMIFLINLSISTIWKEKTIFFLNLQLKDSSKIYWVLPHSSRHPSIRCLRWLHPLICKIGAQQQNGEFYSSAQENRGGEQCMNNPYKFYWSHFVLTLADENKRTTIRSKDSRTANITHMRTNLYHTTLANNTVSDISIKHFGWRQIPGLGVDWRWTIVEAERENKKYKVGRYKNYGQVDRKTVN